MSNQMLHYRLKKLKRAFLIWITLISLLINLWIDNVRFTIFQTKSNQKSRVQIKNAANEIADINKQIDLFNKTMNNQIK